MFLTHDKEIWMENPKCASTSLARYFHEQNRERIRFAGYKNIAEVGRNYEDARYRHVNITGILAYVREELNEDPSDYRIFTLVRNPYERAISTFFYDRRYFKPEPKSVSEYIDVSDHFRRFTPENFYLSDQCEVTAIACENFEVRAREFGLNIASRVVANKNPDRKRYELNAEEIERINTLFHLDFVNGGYEKQSPADP